MPRHRSPSPDRHRHKRERRSRSPHYRERKRSPKHTERRRERDEHDRVRVKKEPRDDHRYGGYHERRHEREALDRQNHERHHNDEKRRKARQDRPVDPFSKDKSDSADHQWGKKDIKTEEEPKGEAKPDFKVSGKLTEDTNTYKGVVIKYNEPPEARKPKKLWRLYPFKGDESMKVMYIHRQSAFLFGRLRRIADIPIDHPSCSKQHAVLQFRLVPFEREDGTKGRRVCPYIIDLGSANGTFVNNQQIEAQKYVQLLEKDVLKFGFSSREYVILHSSSDTSELDDGADDLGVD